MAKPCAKAQRKTKSEMMVGLFQVRKTVDLTSSNKSGASRSISNISDFNMGLGEWEKVLGVC